MSKECEEATARLGTPSSHFICTYLKENINYVTSGRGGWHGRMWDCKSKSWQWWSRWNRGPWRWILSNTAGNRENANRWWYKKDRKPNAPRALQAFSLEAYSIHPKMDDLWGTQQEDNTEVRAPGVANLFAWAIVENLIKNLLIVNPSGWK